MAMVRGNPHVLVALFFGAAVLLMGGLYALVPMALKDPTPGLVGASVGLGASMVFCMAILGRIFWVLARDPYGQGASQSSRK